MGCQVTDEGTKQLIELKELTELRISTLSFNIVDNNNAISADVFVDVLLNLKQLTVLDILLPKIKELYIGKYRTTQGIIKWGKEEQKTWQGTSNSSNSSAYVQQLSYSAYNNIGEKGALAIAENLK